MQKGYKLDIKCGSASQLIKALQGLETTTRKLERLHGQSNQSLHNVYWQLRLEYYNLVLNRAIAAGILEDLPDGVEKHPHKVETDSTGISLYWNWRTGDDGMQIRFNQSWHEILGDAK